MRGNLHSDRVEMALVSLSERGNQCFDLIRARHGYLHPRLRTLVQNRLDDGQIHNVSTVPPALWCGRPDLNRHGKLLPRDFKSLASTISPRPRERADIAHPRRRTAITRRQNRLTGPRDGRSISAARAHGTAALLATAYSSPYFAAPGGRRPRDRR